MYIRVEDVSIAFSRATLIKLSNDDSRATEVDNAIVEQAIRTACERIDAALRGRYRLPLLETPTMLRNHCLYIARHWLYARRPETAMPETVKETYNQAIKELDQIALGRLHLGIAQFEPSASPDKAEDILPDVGEYRVKRAERIDTEGY